MPAFARALRTGATLEVILAAIARAEWSDDPRYIKHPATWLNARGWEDEPTAPRFRPGYNPNSL